MHENRTNVRGLTHPRAFRRGWSTASGSQQPLAAFARTRFAQVEDLVRSHRGFRFRPIQPSLVRELTFAVQRAYAPHRGEAWLPEQAALSELIFADRALGYVRSPQAAEAS